VQLDLRATVGTATVEWHRVEADTGTIIDSGTWEPTERGGDSVISESIGAENAPTTTVQRVTIDQRDGDISITVIEPEKEDER